MQAVRRETRRRIRHAGSSDCFNEHARREEDGLLRPMCAVQTNRLGCFKIALTGDVAILRDLVATLIGVGAVSSGLDIPQIRQYISYWRLLTVTIRGLSPRNGVTAELQPFHIGKR
jgi:hypothetical protein